MAVATIASLNLAFVSMVVCVPPFESKYVELHKDLVPKDISNIQYDYEKKSSGVLIEEYARLLKEKDEYARLLKERNEKFYGDLYDYEDEEDDYNPKSSSPAPDIGGIDESSSPAPDIGGIDQTDILTKNLEKVIGTDAPNVYFDKDWGLFSAVLASYNNHWPLSTGPEDWWTVVLRNVAQALDDYGDIKAVRDLFVAHQGKKKIKINVGSSLSDLDFGWLFDQFSKAIRDNLKTENYVRTVESDFSTTTSDQKIISQVMLMSSMKKYFSYEFGTECGIPGLHMKGTAQDWAKLNQKFLDLEEILKPVEKELELKQWFEDTKLVFTNLNKTFNEHPIDPEVTKWWSRILSWYVDFGSGDNSGWTGWFPRFLGTSKEGQYQSGLVYTEITMSDEDTPPPVKDTGIFVAGTLGFTIREDRNAPPVVEPNQIWNLLLPEGSPVISRLVGHTPRSDL